MKEAKNYDKKFIDEGTIDPPSGLEGPMAPGIVHLMKQKAYKKMGGPSRSLPFVGVGDTGYGQSIYDKGTPYAALDEIAEIRAQRQPWAAKAGSGLGRVAWKVGSEIAKMPGYAGGAIATLWADEGQGWETFVNNSWIKAINNASDSIHEEVLPVYVKRAVKEGNLWDNITSVDFWATEGADGIGFIISMLAPGAALNAFKFGSRVAGLAGRAAQTVDKAHKVAKGLNAIKATPGTIDLVAQTAANTMFEAAAEAQGAGEAYMARMQEKLDAGEITQEAFDYGKAQAMRDVFTANLAILAGPNAVMSKMLWGRRAGKARTKFLDADGNELEGIAAKLTNKQFIKEGAQNFLKAGAREGFFEEGMQSTAEEMFTTTAAEGQELGVMDAIAELPEAYLDMLGTVDGQKAIFLGAMLGGGMQAWAGMKQQKYDKKATHDALRSLETIKSYFEIYKDDVHNEDGSINGARMVEKLQGIAGMNQLSQIYDEAQKAGNQELLNGLHNYAIGEVIKSFVMNPNQGKDALEEYVQKSADVVEFAAQNKQDVADVRKGIIERADKLEKDYKLFQQFAAPFIRLKDNKRPKDLQKFYVTLNADYLGLKNEEYFYEETVKDFKQRRLDVANSLKIDPENIEEATQDNFTLALLNEDVKAYEKDLANVRNTIKKFWKPETHQAKYEAWSTLVEQVEKKQEHQTKADKISKEIYSANDLDALKKVKIDTGDKQTDAYLQEKLNARREELISEEEPGDVNEQQEAQAQASAEAQNAFLDQDRIIEDLGNNIADNYSEGETISLSPDEAPGFETTNGVIQEITDEYVRINAIDLDMVHTIPRAKRKETTLNPDQEFSTEGSINHDAEIPKNNQNGNKDKKSGGSKVLSFNKLTGEVFATPEYRAFELTPKDKTGQSVRFRVNKEGKSSNKETDKQIKKALTAFEKNDFTDMDLLIDYLPLNAVFTEGVEGYTETKPVGEQREATYNATTRPMRVQILNAIVAGDNLDQITTTVQGQNSGALQVDTKDANDNVKENKILELDFFEQMDVNDKLKELQKRLGYVNERGAFVSLDGKTVIELGKENSAGEVYVLIPMANGRDYALKLNIARIKEIEAEILYDLYSRRMQDDPTFGANPKLNEVYDAEELKVLKDKIDYMVPFTGKRFKDLTIKDVTDFFVFDKSLSPKSRIGFNGKSFVFGGTEVTSAESFKNDEVKENFINWLMTEKRHQINLKTKKGSKASAVNRDRKYLDYLVNNKILNTNAVVGKPTFQGFAEIFLDPTNIEGATLPAIAEDKTPAQKENAAKMAGLVALGNKVGIPADPDEAVRQDGETAPTTSKADIEKRRQAEIGTKEKRSFTDDSGVTWTVTITETNKGKVARVSSEKNGEKGGQYTETYPKELPNDKIYESQNGDEYAYTEVEKVEIRGKRVDKINAKYDAELASLEQPKTTGTTSGNNVKAVLDEVMLNKTFIALDASEDFYINSKTGQKYTRVSNYIEPGRPKIIPGENPTVDSSLDIGKLLDVFVRDFFAGNLQPLDTYSVADNALLEEFLKQLEKVKESFDQRGETIIANDILLYNDELGIAGTVDLISYDKEGNVRIYDMKTMRGNQLEREYDPGIKIYDSTRYKSLSNREKHKAQLNMYRILLNNTHGLLAKQLGVMPIEVSYPDKVFTQETSVVKLLPGIPVKIENKVRDAAIKDNKISSEKVTPAVKTDSKIVTYLFAPDKANTFYAPEAATSMQEESMYGITANNELVLAPMSTQTWIKTSQNPDLYFKRVANFDTKGITQEVVSNAENYKVVMIEPGKVSQTGDNIIVTKKIKLAVIGKNEEASSEKLEKTSAKIRKSNKNFVPSHAVPNSTEATKESKAKQNATNKDKLSPKVDAQLIQMVVKGLQKKKLLVIDSGYLKIMKTESNKKQFIYLQKIMKKHNLTVEELLKDCS